MARSPRIRINQSVSRGCSVNRAPFRRLQGPQRPCRFVRPVPLATIVQAARPPWSHAPADTWDHDGKSSTACVPMTNCVPGQRVSEQGSSVRDRVCTDCAAGAFSSTMNTTACTTWTECAAGRFISTPGSRHGRSNLHGLRDGDLQCRGEPHRLPPVDGLPRGWFGGEHAIIDSRPKLCCLWKRLVLERGKRLFVFRLDRLLRGVLHFDPALIDQRSSVHALCRKHLLERRQPVGVYSGWSVRRWHGADRCRHRDDASCV